MPDLPQNGGTIPTDFDWAIYADATFAGLAVLIPIPLVDNVFEWLFRRRMARVISRRRRRPLDDQTLSELERSGCSPVGCLLWPFKLIFTFLKSLSRKILYFLTIKEATDQLSYYWHRAFLLDYMVTAGYLSDAAEIPVSRLALDRTLDQTQTGPLNQLAAQVIGNTTHVLRSLWRIVRFRREDAEIEGSRQMIGKRWDEYRDYWRNLARRFDAAYAEALADRRAQENQRAQDGPEASARQAHDDPET